jgi:hypothetical protein
MHLSVSRDVDLAAEFGASVHLQSAALVGKARQRLGPGTLIGVSAHGLGDVAAAATVGADYVTLLALALKLVPTVSPSWARSCDPTTRAALSADCWPRAKLQQRPRIRLGLFQQALSGGAKKCNLVNSESSHRIRVQSSGSRGGSSDEVPRITCGGIVRRGDRVRPRGRSIGP